MVSAPTICASTSRMCGDPARTRSRTGSALASPTRENAGYVASRLRRPERKSALSLTSATRIAGDEGAADGAVLPEGDAVDFVADRATSRRFKRCTSVCVVLTIHRGERCCQG